MNLNQFNILAQTAPTTTSASGLASPTTTPVATPPPWWANAMFIPMILVAVMLFMTSRSKNKQQKQLTDLLGNLKRGDKVQTIGGIIGTVVEARENDVLIKVDETNNTKIKFARKAIHRVLVDDVPTDIKS